MSCWLSYVAAHPLLGRCAAFVAFVRREENEWSKDVAEATMPPRVVFTAPDGFDLMVAGASTAGAAARLTSLGKSVGALAQATSSLTKSKEGIIVAANSAANQESKADESNMLRMLECFSDLGRQELVQRRAFDTTFDRMSDTVSTWGSMVLPAATNLTQSMSPTSGTKVIVPGMINAVASEVCRANALMAADLSSELVSFVKSQLRQLEATRSVWEDFRFKVAKVDVSGSLIVCECVKFQHLTHPQHGPTIHPKMATLETLHVVWLPHSANSIKHRDMWFLNPHLWCTTIMSASTPRS